MNRIKAASLKRWGSALQQRLAAAAGAASSRPFSPGTLIPEPGDAKLYAEQLRAPHKARQISVLQLENLARKPTPPRLVDSAAFLTAELPARLENHVARLRTLIPSSGSPGLTELLTASADAKAAVLEVASDWRLLPTSDLEGVRHFERHLGVFKDGVEGEMARLMAGAQGLAGGAGWFEREGDVRALNEALDLTHWYVLGLRLMLTQHSASLHALSGGAAAAAAAPASAAHRATDDPLEPLPPGRAPPPPASVVDRAAPLRLLLTHISEDVRAVCVEKNSAAPDIEIVGGEGLALPLVLPYVEFMFAEVLKNATQATVDRYGAWDVDEADPVRVEISEEADGQILVKITDRGLGIPATHFAHIFDWFWSSGRPNTLLSGYGYSRTHGTQMHGIGAGVPVARVIAHFLGGSAHWETSPHELHTTVEVRLPAAGFVF